MSTLTTLTGDLTVGDELPSLRLSRISRTTLALFAGASGDHNPIHIDIDVAHSASEPDVFAHGMLSMAYLARYVTDFAPQEQIWDLGCRFTSITPLFAEPVCRGTVSAVDDETVTLQLRVELADGTPTILGSAVISRADSRHAHH